MHKHSTPDKLKAEYKDDYLTVQHFVNQFDPCGLIFAGAPIDEYDCLTSQLLNGIYINAPKEVLKEIILMK